MDLSDQSPDSGTCSSYKKVVLRVDVQEGAAVVQEKEQLPETSQDFNAVGNDELTCSGKELTPPSSPLHCSMGTRFEDSEDRPCVYRLEQYTYDEASAACRDRGGRLFNARSAAELDRLRTYAGGRSMGIGIRDYGADDGWTFDGEGTSANGAVADFQAAFGQSTFRERGCLRFLSSNSGSSAGLEAISCEEKTDYLCEGTLDNDGEGNVTARMDLKADEGSFCLWHYMEPIDMLPNDEGDNFANTELACSKQVSVHSTKQCGFDPTSRRRGLYSQRGSRFNKDNYPILGSQGGWTGSAADKVFMDVGDAYDRFHCHFSPSNTGSLRMYALQHMYERNYPGELKRKCGCGYRRMANLVSRCDCTRSSKEDNNCAKWHQYVLGNATKDHPVRCNNCNDGRNT
jgi:hypothetical protein